MEPELESEEFSHPPADDVDEEKLFGSWSTNTVSTILFDVRRFEGVFDQILKQLDYLRRRQSAMFDTVDGLSGNFGKLSESVDVINSIVDKNGVYRSRRASMLGGMGASFSEDRSSPQQQPMVVIQENAPPPVDISGIETELQELRGDFDELRNEFHNNHTLENRFKALEQWIQSQLKDHEKRLDGLVLQINEQRGQQITLQNRIESLDRNFQERLDAMRKEFDQKLQNLEYAHVQIGKDIDLKTHSLRDTLSVHDLRARSIETKVSNVSQQQDALREALESLPAQYFDQIYNSINELYAEKANKSELGTKADIALALQKADQGEIDRLHGITDELQRRLIALLAETTDKVAQMDAKLDRRSDRIVAYCLKQLKKDLKNIGSGGATEEKAESGTDIGKVRCLVCNHVSVQQRDQDIVHSGHERLTHTLRAMTRPRSASPPGSPIPQDDSPVKPPTKSRPQTATSDLNYNTTQETAEDPDYIADFRYRTNPATTHGQNDRVKLPVIQAQNGTKVLGQFVTANPAATQSAPLIQIISHHIPMDLKQQHQIQQQPQPGSTSYRDLEQRLHPHIANSTTTTAPIGHTTVIPSSSSKRSQPQASPSGGGVSAFSATANKITSSTQQQQQAQGGGSHARPKTAPSKRA